MYFSIATEPAGSAMQGFDERDRELVDDAIWNEEDMSITTPFVQASTYVEEGIAAMAVRDIDVFQIDLSLSDRRQGSDQYTE